MGLRDSCAYCAPAGGVERQPELRASHSVVDLFLMSRPPKMPLLLQQGLGRLAAAALGLDMLAVCWGPLGLPPAMSPRCAMRPHACGPMRPHAAPCGSMRPHAAQMNPPPFQLLVNWGAYVGLY
jgi:hypothetical protein